MNLRPCRSTASTLAHLAVLILAVFFLAGCSFTGSSSLSSGSILKSTDGGQNWEAKVKIDENKSIAGANVLSMAIDPQDNQIIYIGTKEDGIFVTKDSAESWEKLNFPPVKVYGLAINRFNSQTIFVSGVWQGRGKIYKSEDSGTDWKEIYTEPADGTVITALAASPFDGNVLYAGTSEGAVFKTTTGGKSWNNLTKAPGAITNIVFDFGSADIVCVAVFKGTILRTKDGGKAFIDLAKNIQGGKGLRSANQVFAVAADPHSPGVLYAGLDEGIIKSADYGETWNPLNVLESSKGFPVRAIAVNPQNSQEIIYSSAQAVYQSIDGGVQWSTSQLQTSKSVSVIKYDPQNPGTIYLGLKKE